MRVRLVLCLVSWVIGIMAGPVQASHDGAGQPVSINVYRAGVLIQSQTTVGVAAANGAPTSGTYAVASTATGAYSSTLYWRSGTTGAVSSSFANGTPAAGWTVGAVPTPSLVIDTGDALFPANYARIGLNYRSVTLVETYSDTENKYTAADRYSPATSLSVEVRSVISATEQSPHDVRLLGVMDGGLLLNAVTGELGSPVAVWNVSSPLVIGTDRTDGSADRLYVNLNGARYDPHDVTLFGPPEVTASGLPGGTIYFDPLITTATFSCKLLYPVNWTWLEATTPAGVYVLAVSGPATSLASAGADSFSARAPSGNPSVATSNSSTTERTLLFSLNFEHLRQAISVGNPLPAGDYSFRILSRSSNALSTGGGFGTDVIYSSSTAFTYSNQQRVQGALIAP